MTKNGRQWFCVTSGTCATRMLRATRTLLFLCFWLAQEAAASGFQLYELGTPIVGMAGVGQAAVAEDASTSYFNPAGMTKLDYSQMLIGTQIMNSQTQFNTNSANTFAGPISNKTNLLVPSGGIYYVYSDSACLKYGISLNSPYGGIIQYGDGWAGRYFVQSTALVSLNLNPSMALQINDWLSVGAGFVLQYASIDQTSALPSSGGVDGQADIRVSKTSPGFNLGLLMSCNETRFGLAYRSQIRQRLKGTTSFLRVDTVPRTTVELTTPNSLIASLYQGVNDCFALTGEVGWANWKSFKNTVVNIDGFTLAIPRKWKNTYRFGVGGEYQFMPQYTATLGVSYDSSTTSEVNRLPDLPIDKQMRYGIGLIYTTDNCTRVGLQYAYVDLGRAPIHMPSRLGTLGGSYSKNFLHVLAINVNFGL